MAFNPNQPAADSQPTDATMPPAAPNAGAPAATSQPAATTSPAPTASVQPADAQKAIDQHHSAIGMGAKRLLGAIYGSRTEPKYNAETGQVEDQPVQSRPGDIFRHILAGAIMGGAAAEEAHARNPYMGGVGGAAVGAGAGMAEQQKEQQLKLARAEQEQKADQESQKLKMDKQRADAEAAHWHVEEMHAAFQSNLMMGEAADRHNQYNEGMEQAAQAAGGQVAMLPTADGKTVRGQMNADQFADLVKKNPSAMTTPDANKTRVFVRKFDTTGLHYDVAKKQWLDEDNKPVLASEHTTVTAYDVPLSAWTKVQDFTGKQINDAYDPSGKTKVYDDDNAKVPLSLGQFTALATQGSKLSLMQSEVEAKKEQIKLEGERIKAEGERIKAEMAKANKDSQNANKAVWQSEMATLQESQRNLREMYKDASANFDKNAQAEAAKEMAANDALIKELHDRVMSFEQPSKPISASGNQNKKASDKVVPKATPAAASNVNAVDDNAVVNKTLAGMKARNNMPGSYSSLQSAAPGLNDKQKILAAKGLGLEVPWAEVQRMAKATGKDPNQFSDALKANGVKVERHLASGI